MNEEMRDPQNTSAAAPDDAGHDTGPTPDTTAIDALQRERDDLYDRLLRKTAEFDNFRKRVERDRKDMIEWAAADVIGELLSIVDDFDRAPSPRSTRRTRQDQPTLDRRRSVSA